MPGKAAKITITEGQQEILRIPVIIRRTVNRTRERLTTGVSGNCLSCVTRYDFPVDVRVYCTRRERRRQDGSGPNAHVRMLSVECGGYKEP